MWPQVPCSKSFSLRTLGVYSFYKGRVVIRSYDILCVAKKMNGRSCSKINLLFLTFPADF